MILLRHTGERPDVLVGDLDVGKACVLIGQLLQRLFAPIDLLLGLLVFLGCQKLCNGTLQRPFRDLGSIDDQRDRFVGDLFLQGIYLLP